MGLNGMKETRRRMVRTDRARKSKKARTRM